MRPVQRIKAALGRLDRSPDDEWADQIDDRLFRITNLTRLEAGDPMRNEGDVRWALARPPISAMPLEQGVRALRHPHIPTHLTTAQPKPPDHAALAVTIAWSLSVCPTLAHHDWRRSSGSPSPASHGLPSRLP